MKQLAVAHLRDNAALSAAHHVGRYRAKGAWSRSFTLNAADEVVREDRGGNRMGIDIGDKRR
jgi:hypothetical protein